MARSATEIIDINLFQDDFKNMDQKFLPSVVSIISIFIYENYKPKKQFLLMTKEATFAYGEQICLWLSLEHDMSKPQRISLLNDMKIVQVDSGYDFVTILTEDGRVYLASNNSNWKTNKTFRLISNDNDRFKMIACGGEHLLLLRQDGHVFAMGDNRVGQITGNEKSSYESMINTGIANVKLIACGGNHSFSITNKEEIYSWGPNSYGQLGLSNKEISRTPCLVAFPNDESINIRIKEIVAAGDQHSLFLFENGQLWGCGFNYNGELGLGNRRSKLAKIPIGNLQQIKCSKIHNVSLAYDGSSYYAWGKTKYDKWLLPKKLDGHPTSFASASVQVLNSPITFGLTSTIYEFGSHDSISYKSIVKLFDNQDNYDVKFIIDNKHIKACKCYLKSASEYYGRMFSGNWSENDQVITDYSYETYYAYIRMLHTGKIQINHQNITELVDLANCYGDESLMKYCATFIRNDLDEQTMPKYLPLINKYEMIEMYEKLAHLYKNTRQSSTKRKFF
ncbi:RCC1 and BTB domain-containing protein 2-like [Dermatophagoides farinae]|uniref:RCC1 and BTB domain-containing protein 2-like n=1 Tax=Dermatophagoides farinae TaxID=6954 RepID=UPI003F62DA36